MRGHMAGDADEQAGLDDYGDDQADTENDAGEVIWPPEAGDEE